MADKLTKVPVREQDPQARAANFEEVCLGYNKEEDVYKRQGHDDSTDLCRTYR